MHIPKHYFQDRIVLPLLGANGLLLAAGSLLIVLRLAGSQGNDYIVQYRANLGISAFESGGTLAVLSFIGFMLLVAVFHTLLSMRIYHLRRHASIAVLALGTLLLALAVVVSNALLVLQ
jgi:hypothetical protein